jgi:hypothetical protein
MMNNRISFQRKFADSKGKPIEYAGKTITLLDYYPINKSGQIVYLHFISTNSDWEQGVCLETKGSIKCGDSIAKKGIRIWEAKAPRVNEIECFSKNGILDVYNVWDTGNGCVESWNNGAAMWIEEIPDGRRYHCNDGHFDDDFDELVFEILMVKPEE